MNWIQKACESMSDSSGGGRPTECLGRTAGHGDYGTLDGEPYVCHLPEYERDYAMDDPDAMICYADFARKYEAFAEKYGIVDFTFIDYKSAYLRWKDFSGRK